MNFIERILKTKKIKSAKTFLKRTFKKAQNDVHQLKEKMNNKFEISEKISDIKERVIKTDKKFKISKKASKIKNEIAEKTEFAADKIESVLDNKISFDTFSKVEIKIGKILEAEKIENSEKLLKLKVSFGKNDQRQIISGIAKWYSPQELTGKKATFITNLESKKIMGLDSDGMILGVSQENNFSILSPEKDEIEAGAKAS